MATDYSQFDIVWEDDVESKDAESKKDYSKYDIVWEDDSKPVQPEENKEDPWWKVPAMIGGRAIPSGFIGTLGDLASLLNMVTPDPEVYEGYKKELKEKGTPGMQARNTREFQSLDVLEKPPEERTWSDTQAALADLMGDDDLLGMPFLPPNTEDVSEFIDMMTQDKLKPTTDNQKILSRGGEFLGGALNPITGLPTKLASLGAGAAGMAYESAIQSGASPLLALALSLTSGAAAPAAVKGGASTVKGIGGLIKNPKETIAKGVSELSSFLKKAPSSSELAIKDSLVKSAKELDIPLPASAVTDNNIVKLIETHLNESGLSGDKLDKMRKQITDSFARNVDESLNTISKKTYESSNELGKYVQDSLLKANESAKNIYTKLYDQASSLVPNSAKVKPKNLIKKVNSLIKEMSNTIKPSAEKQTAINYLKDLKSKIAPVEKKLVDNLISKLKTSIRPSKEKENLLNYLENVRKKGVSVDKEVIDSIQEITKTGSFKSKDYQDALNDLRKAALNPETQGVNVKRLINQKKDFHETLDFEALGGSKKRLNELSRAINLDIAEYGSQNPSFYDKFLLADQEFQNYAKTFRENNEVRRALKSQSPESLINFVNKESKKDSINKALKYLGEKQASDVNKAVNRHAFQDLLNKNIYQAGTGEVSTRKLSTFLNSPKNKDKILNLVGPEVYKKIEKLAQVAKGIDEGASRFMNPSKSGSRLTDLANSMFVIKHVVKAITNLNPLYLVTAGFGYKAPKILENLITDPKFIDTLIQVSKDGVSSTKKKDFIKGVQKLLIDISAKAGAEENSE